MDPPEHPRQRLGTQGRGAVHRGLADYGAGWRVLPHLPNHDDGQELRSQRLLVLHGTGLLRHAADGLRERERERECVCVSARESFKLDGGRREDGGGNLKNLLVLDNINQICKTKGESEEGRN